MTTAQRVIWVVTSLIFTPIYFGLVWNTKPVFDWQPPYWVDVAGNILFAPLILIACLGAVVYSLRDLQRTKSIGAALFGFYNLGLGAAGLIVVHAQGYEHFGLIQTVADQPSLTKSDYIYFSIITWTTVGFGDIVPSPAARPLAAEEAILGYIYMAAYIGYVFSALVLLSDYDYSKLVERYAGRADDTTEQEHSSSKSP